MEGSYKTDCNYYYKWKFCEESNCPNWTIEITSTDYEEKPWWLKEI